MTGAASMGQGELAQLMERAAEAGARKALAAVGLSDEDAASDVRDLRGLLDAFRTVKHMVAHTIVNTAARVLTIAVIAGLMAWAGIKLHLITD
ncbi:MAG: hypothetical protein HYR63_07705 [Proteobacteria bacterium]|nr:hypothetical protein [Pseudomonadota bacterium]